MSEESKTVCACSADNGGGEAQKSKKRVSKSRYILIGILTVAAWWLTYSHLHDFSIWLTYQVLGLAQGKHFSSAIEFFIFETPKVMMLLSLVVFAMGVIRSYFSPARTRKILSGKRESLGNLLAALLGVVTPFCSCSAVSLFIGFLTSGIPLGVTFSFLIAAPMINEIALVLLFGLFGWKIALIYLTTGLVIAIIAGWVIGRLKMEKYVEPWVYQQRFAEASVDEELGWENRAELGTQAFKDIVGKV